MLSATITPPKPAKAGAGNIACALNDTYEAALRRKSFKIAGNMYGTTLTNSKGVSVGVNNVGHLSCCGISELNFLAMAGIGTLDGDDFEELVAKYIEKSVHNSYKDNRILIVGLPIENMDGHNSSYDFTFYNRLLKVLLSFGFRQAGKKYENQNSHNKLAVLVAQMT